MSCTVEGCIRAAKAKGLCGMHYKRFGRHGTLENTRPLDWGTKGTHPLYNLWMSVRRQNKRNIDTVWLNFWQFVTDVKNYPENAGVGTYPIFVCADNAKPIGPNNYKWVIREKSESLDAQRIVRAAYMREYNSKNKEQYRSAELHKRYGIRLEDYNTLLKAQNGVCAICKNPETLTIKGALCKLAVDHCHDTSKVRGLLCSKCNRGIGLLAHSVNNLASAIHYLKTGI